MPRIPLLLVAVCLGVAGFWSGNRNNPTSLLQDTDADGMLLFGGAPPAVKDVIANMGGMSTSAQARAAAAASYKAELQGFEREEAAVGHDSPRLAPGVVPAGPVDSDPDAPGGEKAEAEAEAARSAAAMTPEAAEAAEVKGTEAMIHAIEAKNGLSPQAVRQPLAGGGAAEQPFPDGAAEVAARGRRADRERQLEQKVKVLEGLNARLALGGEAPAHAVASQPQQQLQHIAAIPAASHANPAAAAAAQARARQVAAAGLEKAEARADQVAAGDFAAHSPTGAATAAEQHTLRVAAKAGAAAAAGAERFTGKMLEDKGKYALPKLPGVVESAWAGVKRAVSAGRPDASGLKGVKESTWPFAPGSFKAKDKVIPGVKEDSWWVFEPGSSWAKDRKAPKGASAGKGGCVPDSKTGKLVCDGGVVLSQKELGRAFGMADVRAREMREAGEVRTAVPEIRTDAESQQLDAAAAAFAREGKDAAGTEMLAQQRGAASARRVQLDAVGGQCSTLLDCIRTKYAELVPHHTRPIFGADADVYHHVGDARPEKPLWVDHMDIRVPAGDASVARIARPSARSPSGQSHDVPAVRYPSSAGTTMYAHAVHRARLLDLGGEGGGQMLAGAGLVMLAGNESAGNGTAGGNGTKPHDTVCDLGVNCDSRLPEIDTRFNDTGRLCGPGGPGGVNCDSGFIPLTARAGDYQDVEVKDPQKKLAPTEYGVWTPFMYGPNKPTGWVPGGGAGGGGWQPDYAFMARAPGVRGRQVQMMRAADGLLAGAERGMPAAPAGAPAATQRLFDGPPARPHLTPATTNYGNQKAVDREPPASTGLTEATRNDGWPQSPTQYGFSAVGGRGEGDGGRQQMMAWALPGWEDDSEEPLRSKGVNVDSGWSPYRAEDIWGKYRRAAEPEGGAVEGGGVEEEEGAGEGGGVADEEAEERARYEEAERRRKERLLAAAPEGAKERILEEEARRAALPPPAPPPAPAAEPEAPPAAEEGGKLDELDRLDLARGWDNAKRGLASIVGMEPAGHTGSGWSVLPRQVFAIPQEGEGGEAEEGEDAEWERKEAGVWERRRKAHLLGAAPGEARRRITEEEERRRLEGGGGEGGAVRQGLWEQGLGEMNRVTGDVDRITGADDRSDMGGLRDGLRDMVEGMRRRK